MPINYKEYHPKWSLISRLIRFKRAKNRCEKCGVANGLVIKRIGLGVWRDPNKGEWNLLQDYLYRLKFSYKDSVKKAGLTIIVLTVAHLDHDKTNNRFWNLSALCQSCHLHHDKAHHAANRKYGRNYKKDQIKLNFQ
jgi:hypothetical protein